MEKCKEKQKEGEKDTNEVIATRGDRGNTNVSCSGFRNIQYSQRGTILSQRGHSSITDMRQGLHDESLKICPEARSQRNDCYISNSVAMR